MVGDLGDCEAVRCLSAKSDVRLIIVINRLDVIQGKRTHRNCDYLIILLLYRIQGIHKMS